MSVSSLGRRKLHTTNCNSYTKSPARCQVTEFQQIEETSGGLTRPLIFRILEKNTKKWKTHPKFGRAGRTCSQDGNSARCATSAEEDASIQVLETDSVEGPIGIGAERPHLRSNGCALTLKNRLAPHCVHVAHFKDMLSERLALHTERPLLSVRRAEVLLHDR